MEGFEGYFTGMLDLYFATMDKEDTSLALPEYGTPEVLAKGIETTITPTYREGKLAASNAIVRSKKQINTYTVSLHVDKVPFKTLEKILGRKTDANGVQIIKGSDNAPNVALGFAFTLDDGSIEFWWIYKGSFSELTKSAKTEDDSIEYQTPTIEATFVRRMCDNALAAVVEIPENQLGGDVAKNWFKEVYNEAIEAEGTVTDPEDDGEDELDP